MKWNKKGKIDLSKYCGINLVTDFVMLPTPILLKNKILRIFVGFCDDRNVGRVGYVDVEPDCPNKIIGVSEQPVLNIGQKGCFDDNGVVPLSIVRVWGGGRCDIFILCRISNGCTNSVLYVWRTGN